MKNPMCGRMAGYLAMAMYGAAMGSSIFGGGPYVYDNTARPVKKCLQCGKEHSHNNCWCSSECCHKYRQQQKESQGVAAKLRTTSANQNASSTSVAPAVQPVP